MKDSEKVKEALGLIGVWAGIDGEHHKQWLLNELVHVLADDYDKWVADWENGEDGPKTYEWDNGIAP